MTCDQCRKPIRGRFHKTTTGRILCTGCHDTLIGLTAGAASSGGSIGTSISVAGWYKGLRKNGRDGS